jgi:hypothetical protein
VIVYVDDLKIAGPMDNVEKAWVLIRGPNPRAGPTPAGKFLGCNREVSHVIGATDARRSGIRATIGGRSNFRHCWRGSALQCCRSRPWPTCRRSQTYQNRYKQNNADLIQQPLDGAARIQADQPLDGESSDKPNDGSARVRNEQPLEGKCSDNVLMTVEEQPECLPTSGKRGPITGYVCCEQIKYDVSDFLGSCVRPCKDFTNSHDEPLKPAHTPFIDETGDDYGLGGGVCDEAPDGSPSADAYMDIERTLQELAQNACVGEERSGYYCYVYQFEDVEDCHETCVREAYHIVRIGGRGSKGIRTRPSSGANLCGDCRDGSISTH